MRFWHRKAKQQRRSLQMENSMENPEGQKKILAVIEDDEAMRHVIAENVTSSGYAALSAENGEEGLAKILENKPDLVILDLLLPQIDGFEVLRRVRSNPDPAIANIPVVILSNLWSNKDILAAQALKIEAYFIKTQVTMPEVMQRVKEVLQPKH
jgi:DNA-binding response OmpR family regulator